MEGENLLDLAKRHMLRCFIDDPSGPGLAGMRQDFLVAMANDPGGRKSLKRLCKKLKAASRHRKN